MPYALQAVFFRCFRTHRTLLQSGCCISFVWQSKRGKDSLALLAEAMAEERTLLRLCEVRLPRSQQIILERLQPSVPRRWRRWKGENRPPRSPNIVSVKTQRSRVQLRFISLFELPHITVYDTCCTLMLKLLKEQ